MTEKTEALRLADALYYGEYDVVEHGQQTAAELRRLHAEVERLSWDSVHTCHAECQRPLCKVTRERDALLAALLELVEQEYPSSSWDAQHIDYEISMGNGAAAVVKRARAAIAKAEDA